MAVLECFISTCKKSFDPVGLDTFTVAIGQRLEDESLITHYTDPLTSHRAEQCVRIWLTSVLYHCYTIFPAETSVKVI